MQDDSSKLSEEIKPGLYLQTHPYNSSTCSHVCSFLEKLIPVTKTRCLLLSYQPPSPFFPLSLFLIAMPSSGKTKHFTKINFTYQIHLCQHLHPIPGKHDFHLFYFSPILHQVQSQYLLQDHYTNHLLTTNPHKKKKKKLIKISHCSRYQH